MHSLNEIYVADSDLHTPLLHQLAQPEGPGWEGIKLWLVNLDFSPERLGNFFLCLDEDEQRHFHRFRCTQARYRFAACRSCLKYLLAQTFALNMKHHSVAYTAYGKPYLPGEEMPAFSISHTARQGCIALSERDAIGVDIEAHAHELPFDLLSQQFTTCEQHFIRSGSPARFYDIWARKEAVLKAWGTGLFTDMHTFCVAPEPHAQVKPAGTGIRLTSFHEIPGHALAVATKQAQASSKTQARSF